MSKGDVACFIMGALIGLNSKTLKDFGFVYIVFAIGLGIGRFL